jgi:hypothetical protein
MARPMRGRSSSSLACRGVGRLARADLRAKAHGARSWLDRRAVSGRRPSGVEASRGDCRRDGRRPIGPRRRRCAGSAARRGVSSARSARLARAGSATRCASRGRRTGEAVAGDGIRLRAGTVCGATWSGCRRPSRPGGRRGRRGAPGPTDRAGDRGPGAAAAAALGRSEPRGRIPGKRLRYQPSRRGPRRSRRRSLRRRAAALAAVGRARRAAHPLADGGGEVRRRACDGRAGTLTRLTPPR